MTAAEKVLSRIEAVQDWLEDVYVRLHENPELSSEEVETARYVTDLLSSWGYDVQHVGGGVVGVLANGEGPTVLGRADMDGLPVVEATGLPYASTRTTTDATGGTVGVMHACGHDVHVTAGLGAARLLAEARDAWSGTYVALFQPAEETAAGARAMVADGLVDRVPRPDVAFAQHVLTSPAAGEVATAPGAVLSAGDSIRITVFGTGSHGSMPHLGVDPVVIAASVVMRLQTVVAREIAPSAFGVVTVGSVQAGSKSNIIPDRAVLLVNVRTYDLAVRETILSAIERIVRGECAASGSPQEPTFEYYDQYPLTANDTGVVDTVTQAFRRHFGEERVRPMEPAPASEDFSIVPDAFGIPYCYWGLGGFLPGTPVYPNHNPKFAPAMEPTLRTGAEALVVAALSYLATIDS